MTLNVVRLAKYIGVARGRRWEGVHLLRRSHAISTAVE